jgi:hypothetical protein
MLPCTELRDNEFSSAAMNKLCRDKGIRLDTSDWSRVAKGEQISLAKLANGNKLGIIEREVKISRELMENYFDISGHTSRTDNVKDVVTGKLIHIIVVAI